MCQPNFAVKPLWFWARLVAIQDQKQSFPSNSGNNDVDIASSYGVINLTVRKQSLRNLQEMP